MADGNKLPPSDNNTRSNSINHVNNEESEEATSKPLQLDLGDDLTHLSGSNRLGSQNAGASGSNANEIPNRREDNPFSFKQFLRNDSNDYQNKGARPKVYYEGRPISSISDVDLQPPVSDSNNKFTRVVPEYSSALPDFVQDHLVIEQCYLANNNNINSSNNEYKFPDINLPDFTHSRDSININRIALDTSQNHRSRNNENTSDLSIPLDLPIRSQIGGFPFDLPNNQSPPNCTRSCPTSEVGVSKSLPDFLADSAVCTQKSDGLSSDSPERDTDRLRNELDIVRRQLQEQTLRCENLNRELKIAKNRENDFTQSLVKGLQEAEENLKKSNRRAISAENTILKLRQEIKSLTYEINDLKSENRSLRGEEGAAGGHDYYAPNHVQSQRLAQELKIAASTAEHSLRQLLTGVDNLRIMAASLENMKNRIEEPNESFLNLDDDSGPAL